jgi:polyphosphate kinase
VLGTYLADNTSARRMLPEGSYERLKPRSKEAAIDSQAVLLTRNLQKG